MKFDSLSSKIAEMARVITIHKCQSYENVTKHSDVGHMKSVYPDMLPSYTDKGYQRGSDRSPSQINKICYIRMKVDRLVNRYHITITVNRTYIMYDVMGKRVTKVYLSKWSQGYLMLVALLNRSRENLGALILLV